jgi:hypothetical protein
LIDATGDGDVAARAGVPYRLGRMSDGLCQPMTLMFEIEGVKGFSQRGSADLYEKLAGAIEAHALSVELPFRRGAVGTPWIIDVPRPDSAVVQATHVYRLNATDTRQLSRATIEARRQAHELVSVMKHVAGLEGIRLVQTAPQIGVRETRRLCGRYTLSVDDLRAGRTFEDAVTFATFGIDIHDVDPGGAKSSGGGVRPYEIPYRCLLPESLAGLLFAGRCISGTHVAHGSYRVTGNCMAMGQAAGLAAAMAAAENCAPHEIDGARLRRELLERGVGLLGTS